MPAAKVDYVGRWTFRLNIDAIPAEKFKPVSVASVGVGTVMQNSQVLGWNRVHTPTNIPRQTWSVLHCRFCAWTSQPSEEPKYGTRIGIKVLGFKYDYEVEVVSYMTR